MANCQWLRLAFAAASCSIVFTSALGQQAERGTLMDLMHSRMGVPEYVPGEILVKFKEGTVPLRAGRALDSVQGVALEHIHTDAMAGEGRNGIVRLRVPGPIEDAIARLSQDPNVEFAEPNWVYRHSYVSNDTYYTNGSLWGMYGAGTSPANQYGSHAGTAWANNHIGSPAIYVGIIDEGYMYTHVDLAANAGTVPGEIAGNGIDDNGNGYVDDVYGWDFVSNNNSVFDGVGDDHASHVAGTIGGVGGNGQGVAGVCWNVKLLNAKFLGTNGGTTANAIKAVDYFNGLKDQGVNLVATNNSWGGGGFSSGLQAAIERANTRGILFVASAGNSAVNTDSSPSYPGSYNNANIICVASITSTGGLSSFSNYGAVSVDLGAPGSGIVSTVPKKQGRNIVSGYASYSGTSMAGPHVTGAAALWLSTHPGATAAQIKAAILGSVTATASLNGKCQTGGRLNVSGF